MKKMISFNDYHLKMIIESINKDEVNLILSDNLHNLLKDLNHPIAQDIIELEESGVPTSKITYIDIDDTDALKKDMVSFLNSNKVLDNMLKDEGFDKDDDLSHNQMVEIYDKINKFKEDKFNIKNRAKTKIGRIIGKLFPGKYKQSGLPGSDIESFVNVYKAARDTANIEIVEGEELRKWYHEDNYAPGGQLNKSCMKHSHCQDYLGFYVVNKDKVSMAILKDTKNPNKIRGRALLWKLDSPSDRIFMDRIYTVKDSEVLLFKDYAKENGWIYKYFQNFDEGGPFIDSRTGKEIEYNLVIDDLIDPGSGSYPFMDTMRFFDGETISNAYSEVGADPMNLEGVNGEPEEESGVWSDYYNDFINEDEMIWCDFGDEYRYEQDCFYSSYYELNIAEDWAEKNMTELDNYDDYNDKWRKPADCIETYEGNSCSPEYAEIHYSYSQTEGEWVENAVWSEYHNDYLPEDTTIEVYTDVAAYDTDYRVDHQRDGSWWIWDYDNEKYDDDISEEDLQIHHGFEEVYLDAEQDESGYVEPSDYWTWEHDGEKYSDDVTEEELREFHGLDDE